MCELFLWVCACVNAVPAEARSEFSGARVTGLVLWKSSRVISSALPHKDFNLLLQAVCNKDPNTMSPLSAKLYSVKLKSIRRRICMD